MFKLLIAEVAALFLWLLNMAICSTLRLKINNFEIIEKIYREGRHIIFAFWHQAAFPLFYYYRDKRICIMPIAALRGEILCRLARRYNYEIVPYPQKGTPGERMESVVKMVSVLKEGFDGALAVDGPPQPQLYKAKAGVLLLSQKTGHFLVPAGVYMKRKITCFWRWDKYQIPLPFSTVVIAFGEPLTVPVAVEVSELEEKTSELEEKIHKATLMARKFAYG